MGGEGQLLRRIPRIKFPKRHSSSGSQEGREIATGVGEKYQFPTQASGSDVLPSTSDAADVGGKASLQPRRTPVTEREIEAVMLGGCF
ncbi:unnamed protein product [Linum trigynum]|uniref:Uncharacterized protein n=1 Tax=Linum trigynum TaxID=586398 RepID=A0AAV2EZ10_9ROSI